MTRHGFVLCVLGFILGVVGCREPGPSAAPAVVEGPNPSATPSPSAAPSATPSPSPGATAEQAFGAPLVGDRAPIALSTLLDQPEAYTGQVVRTEGEITAVCQNMGCWMELRDERERAVRVPMAGHAFFLPRDVAGRRALVEGPLSVRPLSAAEREHLASEGATATDVALELSATSVVVRAPSATL